MRPVPTVADEDRPGRLPKSAFACAAAVAGRRRCGPAAYLVAVRSYMRSVAVPAMLRRFGVAPAPRTRFLAGQRAILLAQLGVQAVVDVGANVGQYGKELRRSGYAGDIYSFEPGSEALRALRGSAAGDAAWFVSPVAFGAQAGIAHLHTWSGEGSSAASLRTPVQGVVHMLGQPDSETVGVETLARWLDMTPVVEPANSLLKIDVQGSERDVLLGAGERLREFAMVELEAPAGVWYEGQASLPDLLILMGGNGFLVSSIMTERFHTGWRGAPDVDILFIRSDLSRLPAAADLTL